MITTTQTSIRAAFILLAISDVITAAEICALLHANRGVYSKCVTITCGVHDHRLISAV
jgi:hypothetical protein